MVTNMPNMGWEMRPSHSAMAMPRAVRDALVGGCNFTRPAAIEVECAEQFLGLIDGAEMVKFCKDGSDATSQAQFGWHADVDIYHGRSSPPAAVR
jgi:hypothetical protein